jgi:hypothetical protein
VATIRATGPSGTLRVGYQWAADLGAWRMEPSADHPHAFVLRSTVLRRHDYWFTQYPMDLALRLGGTEWLWRGVSVAREGDLVAVTLSERPVVSDR